MKKEGEIEEFGLKEEKVIGEYLLSNLALFPTLCAMLGRCRLLYKMDNILFSLLFFYTKRPRNRAEGGKKQQSSSSVKIYILLLWRMPLCMYV